MSEHKLYNGEVSLFYDPRPHTYAFSCPKLQIENEPLLNVTGILGCAAKPALDQWRVDVSIDWLRSQWMERDLNEEDFEAARLRHKAVSEGAARSGSEIHKWIDSYIKSKIHEIAAPPIIKRSPMQEGIQSFLDWEKQNEVKFLECERPVMSLSYRVAGCLDLNLIYQDRKCITDMKSVESSKPHWKQIWIENRLQTAAYVAMDVEERVTTELDPDFDSLVEMAERLESERCDRLIIKLDREGKRPPHSELLDPSEFAKDMESFLGLLMFWQNKYYEKPWK